MVNITYCYLQKMRHRFPQWTPLDPKTQARGIKYVEEVMKLLPKGQVPNRYRWRTRLQGICCYSTVSAGRSQSCVTNAEQQRLQ